MSKPTDSKDRGPFILDPDWLEERLDRPGISIIDGSWYLPSQDRNAREEYEAAHIPGAVFFDQNEVVEPGSNLPHTLPSPIHFAQHAGAMGISADDTIIVYDGPGLFSAARVWWMFRTMGVEEVYILDGGMDRWKAEGRKTTSEPTRIAPCVFHASFQKDKVVGLSEMRQIVAGRSSQIADARSSGRFAGEEPEPRPGVRSGHMPGARSLPASSLSKNGGLLPAEALREMFDHAGIDLAKPVVTSCGSGVTAAVINLALESLGHTDNRLYDGSWTEWGGQSDTPVETGNG